MWRQTGRFVTWQHSSWAIIMELGRGPLHGEIIHQAKKKRIYQSYVEQFFIDFLARFCLRRAISHLKILSSRLGWKVHNVNNVDRYLHICVSMCACIHFVISLT